MIRLAVFVSLLFGPVLAALAQSNAPVEAPVESVGAWAIWLFGLIFVGACGWFALAVMRSNKNEK